MTADTVENITMDAAAVPSLPMHADLRGAPGWMWVVGRRDLILSRPPMAPAPHANTDDKALMERLARGDVAALKAAYDLHAGKVMAVAVRLLRNRSDAEEVVQETFLDVWRSAARLDSERGSLQAWILTVARNRSVDRLRSRAYSARLGVAVSMEPPVHPPGPSENAARHDDARRVQRALEDLPREQRDTIQMAYFEALTQREIAERTGQPLGTIKSRLKLALHKLGAHLSAGNGGRP